MSGLVQWVAALHDDNPDIRIDAIRRLAEFPDATRVPLLVDMLGDPEWRVRKAAANDLKQQAWTPALMESLIAVITDSDDPWQRMAAMDVAVSLGARDEENGRVATAFMEVLKTSTVDQRKFIAEVLGLMGVSGAVRPLIEELRSEDENLQASTLDALAKIGDRRAIPAVIERLQRGTASVRFAALTALQQLGDASAEPAVLQALEDPTLRRTAMDVLAQIGEEQTVLALWRWWSTGTAQERNEALVAMGRVMQRLSEDRRGGLMGTLRGRYQPAHRAGLLAAVESSDPVVQRAAIRFAGWVREPAAVTPLVQLLGGELAEEAKQALSMMVEEHLAHLRTLVPRATPTIYRALIELLSGSTHPSVLPIMKEALVSADARVRRAAVLGIAGQRDRASAPALVGLLLDRDSEVQEAAVWALGRCDNEAVVASVIELLGHESSTVRVLAARALGLLRTAEGGEPLTRALHDPDPAVRAAAVASLAGLGDHVGNRLQNGDGLANLNDHLLLALGDEAPNVRLEAARALQRRQATVPVHWWRCLADDPDQWVRAVAARSAAVGATGDAEQAAALHRYLRDESGAVRIAVLEAITEHPETGDADAVRNAMRSEDPDVIAAALTALAAMAARRPVRRHDGPVGAPGSLDSSNPLFEAVLPTLLHPVWTVRAAGMKALIALDPDRARRRLTQLAEDDSHPQVRREATRLLSEGCVGAHPRRTARSERP